MKALKELEPFYFSTFSQKLIKNITRPLNLGTFSPEISSDRALGQGIVGSIEEETFGCLKILVDLEDHKVIDAKFQGYGASFWIGVLEGLCALLVNKTVSQAKKISADLLESSLRDQPGVQALSSSCFEALNLAIDLLIETLESLPEDLQAVQNYSTPFVEEGESHKIVYPEFFDLKTQEQLKILQDIVEQDIAPYVALDDGGVSVKAISIEKEVVIAYSGTCTSCYSAIGSTLSAIEQMIQKKVHPELKVIPDMESLNF